MSSTTPDAKKTVFHHDSDAKIDPDVNETDKIKYVNMSFEDKINELSKELLKVICDTSLDRKEKLEDLNFMIDVLREARHKINVDDERISQNNGRNARYIDNVEVYRNRRSNNTEQLPKPKGMKNDIILSKKDEFGQFYTFRTVDDDEVKYYYDNPNVQFERSLHKLKDIPLWCKAFSNYLEVWNFDNITKMDNPEKIDKAQKFIIKKIIKGSISGDFELRNLDDKDGVELFFMITNTLKKKYTRSTKDRMWREIVIDEFCSDTTEMYNKLFYMCQLEIWSCGGADDIPMTDSKLKRKLKECLTKEMAMELMSGEMEGDFDKTLKELTTEEYVEAIEQTVLKVTGKYCENHNILELEKRPCLNCSSLFHQAKNCHLGYSNHINTNNSTFNHKNTNGGRESREPLADQLLSMKINGTLLSMNKEKMRGPNVQHTTEQQLRTTPNNRTALENHKKPNSSPPKKNISILEIHLRLNHFPVKDIIESIKMNNFNDVSVVSDTKTIMEMRCESCMAGHITNTTRYSHYSGSMNYYSARREPGSSWSLDVVGPVPDVKERYMLLMVDSVSRFMIVTTHATKHQNEIGLQLERNIKWIERQFDTLVRELFMDRGKEFDNQTVEDMATREGIKIIYTTTEDHQTNVRREQGIRTIVGEARTLLLQARLPPRFWTYAVRSTVNVRNSLFNKTVGESPLMNISAHKVNIYLRSFLPFGASVMIKDRTVGTINEPRKRAITLSKDPQGFGFHFYIPKDRKVISTSDYVSPHYTVDQDFRL